MIKGDFCAIPPIAITPLIGIPSVINRSAIFFAPKQVASTKALNTLGEVLPKFNPEMTPFKFWLASGVLLPFIQSKANSPEAPIGSFEASSLNLGIKFPRASSINFVFVAASGFLIMSMVLFHKLLTAISEMSKKWVQ